MSNDKSQIQEKLASWAKETVDVYNPIADTLNKESSNEKWGYYTQTPLSLVSQSPDLLILGINPGFGGGKEIMSGEELLKGNPCFENIDKKDVLSDKEFVIYVMKEKRDEDKNRNGWALWHRMNNMLKESSKAELLEKFDNFVLSNMIFFGTDHENEIPKIDKEKCAKQTLKLIDYLEPKVVILLGKQSRDLYNRITDKGKLEVLVPNSIYHCMYEKSHVLAIKHTAYYYSYAEMVVVGKTIGYILDNHEKTINKETIYSSDIKEDIFHFEERQKKMQSKSNIKKSDDPIVKRAKELEQIINCEGANKGINNDGTLEYEYYCYSKTNGKFLEKNGVIRVGLRYDKNNQQYVLSVKSLGNNPDALIHKIKVYCSKEDLFKFDKGKDTVSYEDAIFRVETIANFMDGLLAMIKTYRETDYPEK